MLKQLRLAGVMLVAGFALAAVYGLAGPKAHSSALSGSVIISTGVFDGSNQQVGSSIPSSVDTPAEFKTYINNMLFSVSAYGIPGSSYNAYGAAFIVETMVHGQINYNADDPTLTQARNDFNTWASYIDQYQAAGRINWSFSTTEPAGAINSMHVCDTTKLSGCGNNYRGVYNNTNGTDAHRYQFYNNGSPEASTEIIFTNPNGSTFRLRRECANVTGGASPLSNLGWNLDGQIFEAAGKTSIYANESVNFVSQIRNNGPATAYSFWEVKYCYDTCPTGYDQTYTTGLDTTLAPNGAWETMNTWGFSPPHNTTHTKICALLHFSDTTGPSTPWENTTPVCVTIIPLVSSCGGLVINPTLLGSTDNYTVTGSVNVNGGQPGAQTVDNDSNFFINISGPGVSSNNSNVTPVTVGGSAATSGTGTLTATYNASPTNNVGTYTVTYGITGSTTPISCSGTFQVALRPYFSVRGGDIMTGSGFGDSCAATETVAYIKSWNLGTTATPNYYGAGGEIGVIASGNITNFVSGMGLSGGIADPGYTGYGLSFANTSNLSGGGYGGNFGIGGVPCMYDYYGSIPNPDPPSIGSTTVGSFASVAAGVYKAPVDGTGTFTLGGSGDITLGAGKQITIYLDGNLYIKNNILYNYATVADIPRLNVYVKGNIYIDPAVSEIHGVYTAQKNTSGGGGILNTCNPGTVTATQPYATCNRQLKIVGAVATQATTRLTRTYGNLAPAPGITNQPAEIFQYSPELWMANSSDSNYKYQAYSGLPPVL